MIDLAPEPTFDSSDEELASLKRQITHWKRNQNAVSADAILLGYQVRYQQLRKELAPTEADS